MSSLQNIWPSADSLKSHKYVCYFCNITVGSDKGYQANTDYLAWHIYICSNCHIPNMFKGINFMQILKPLPLAPVKHVEKDIESLFEEARKCMSSGTYTAVAMICRKLLMNIAVNQGAKENQNFKDYSDYLKSSNILSQSAKNLLEAIREIGNDANHEITQVSEDKADLILKFTYEVINQIYMVPTYLPKKQPDQKTTTNPTN